MKCYKAHAKVNIFLKITGKRGEYHEIISRFMKVENLYDELSFVPKEQTNSPLNSFTILGDFNCSVESNTIYKAYRALQNYKPSASLERLMQTHAVRVEKNIPSFAGLGGGSSDAATFLKMCNRVLDLGLSLNELAHIGLEVGADVPFFIYNFTSANVSGIGEIVEPFDEVGLDFEIYTPKIEVSTPEVYRRYTEKFYAPIDAHEVQKLKTKPSLEVLESMDIYEANDLFEPAVSLYPKLKEFIKEGWFFSGSGSSFFKLDKGDNKNG